MKDTFMRRLVIPCALALVLAWAPVSGALDYVHDIQPVLQAKCGPCHADGASMGGHGIATHWTDFQKGATTCDEQDDGSMGWCALEKIAQGEMPLEGDCEGWVDDDAWNADSCITETEYMNFEQWVDDGMPYCAGEACEGEEPPSGCDGSSDCDEDQVCFESQCITAQDCYDVGTAAGCSDYEVCSANYECVADGTDGGSDMPATASADKNLSYSGGCQSGPGSLGWLVGVLATLAVALIRRRPPLV